MQFEALPREGIPELPKGTWRTWEHLGQLCGQGLRIPGVVLRGANIHHTKDETIDGRLGLNEGAIVLGGCISIMTVTRGSTPDTVPDCGWHRDPARQDVRPGQIVINANTNVEGVGNVKIIMAQPEISEAALVQYDQSETFKGGSIDSSLFVPVLYEATLYPEDVILHRDNRAIHSFETETEPRTYSSGMYPVFEKVLVPAYHLALA